MCSLPCVVTISLTGLQEPLYRIIQNRDSFTNAYHLSLSSITIIIRSRQTYHS